MIPSPRRSNCLFWALGMWRRDGGYLLVRRSYHAWWLPHFAWMPPGMAEAWSYIPIVYDPKYYPWRPIAYLWFSGKVTKEIGYYAEGAP